MARKTQKNENYLDTDGVIKELSERAGFTKSDTKIFLDCFAGLIADSIEQNIDVNIRGLFRLYTQKIKAFRGVNAYASRIAKETIYDEFPESRRVIIKLATNMTDLLRADDKKKIKKVKQDGGNDEG